MGDSNRASLGSVFVARKRVRVLLLVSVLLASGLGAVFPLSFTASAEQVLHVGCGGPGNYSTIQAAVDAASAGDTVYVCNGTYYEHIYIDKTITLTGEDRYNTTINGNDIGSAISAYSSITISGFTVTHGYLSGVSLLGGGTAYDNILSGNFIGMYFNFFGSIVFNNIFENNSIGIVDGPERTGDSSQLFPGSEIYHNDFINNGAGMAYNHTWDNGYPSGGNYWSDYMGVDNFSGPNQDIPGPDGIGDTPYTGIDGPNGTEDIYPFMEPWHLGLYNSPPVITTSDISYAFINEQYYNDYDAINPDGDTLSWNLTTSSSFLTIDPNTGVLSGTPSSMEIGSYWANISVDDSEGGIDWSNFTLTVLERPKTLNVGCGGPGNYSTIQAGVDAASDGDTVHVCAGTYNEKISVDTAINLIGDSLETTTIIGNGIWNPVTITSNWVNMTGFTIEGSAVIGFHEAGIFLDKVRHNNIYGNRITNNLNGIVLNYSDDNVIDGNEIYSNTEAGIMIHNSNANNISNNYIHSNGPVGIYLYQNSNYNTISYNLCSAQGASAIEVYMSNNNNIRINHIFESSYAIRLRDYADYNVVEGNWISNNNYGIYIQAGDWNHILENTFDTGMVGVYLKDTIHNVISRNSIDSYAYGLYLMAGSTDVSYNSITNNIIRGSSSYGIYLRFWPENNIIYNNDLISNAVHAYDDGSGNQWSAAYPQGGNYWDDYSGIDVMNGTGQDIPGGDGIGDTPYSGIQGATGSQDGYPLMTPWSLDSFNNPPVINTTNIKTGYAEIDYYNDYEADDLDGDALMWLMATNASWISLNSSTGELHGTPAPADAGLFFIYIHVTDSKGGWDREYFSISVLTNGTPPNITTYKSAFEDMVYPGDIIHYNILLNNTGGNVSRIVWVNDSLPQNVSFISASNNGIYTPGDHTVRWLLSNMTGFSSIMLFINVSVNMDADEFGQSEVLNNATVEYISSNDNEWDNDVSNDVATTVLERPLHIITPDVTTAVLNVPYYNDYDAYNPNEGVLVWSLSTDAEWLDINTATGEIYGTPSEEMDVGLSGVNISVNDGLGGVDNSTFSLAVYPYLAPPAITIEKVSDASIIGPGETITYTIYFNNTGDTTARTVWINETFPDGVSYISSNADPKMVGNFSWVFDNVPGTMAARNDWDGPISTENHPSFRKAHAMTYDSFNDRVVLFGGQDTNGDYNGETWEYDANTNTWYGPYLPSPAPSGRIAHSMAFDSVNNRVILLGGYDEPLTGHESDETWEYDTSTHTWAGPYGTAHHPESLVYNPMAFDPTIGKTVTLGGNSDVWEYSAAAHFWSQTIIPGICPSVQMAHGLVYDPLTESIIIFGGQEGWDHFNDTWEYDSSSHTFYGPYQSSTSPPPLVDFSMAYNPVRGRAMLFGGLDETSEPYFKDTVWEYDSFMHSWSNPEVIGPSPYGRWYTAMASDSESGVIVMFGGESSLYILTDTWEYHTELEQKLMILVSVNPDVVNGEVLTNFVQCDFTDSTGTPITGTSDSVDTIVVAPLLMLPGPNYISIPKKQADTTLQTVLSSISGKYDKVVAYDASNPGDHWKEYTTYKPGWMSDLADIDHTMGLIVNIIDPEGAIFTPSGDEPTDGNNNIQLYTGWNMVGFPSLSNKDRDTGLNNLEVGVAIGGVYYYDSDLEGWMEVDMDDSFHLGSAYKIYAFQDCVWDVPL